MTTTDVAEPTGAWRASAGQAARRLAAITAGGALVGFVVGGIGGRLAMMVLARLNEGATGITSDDGFVIGQFGVLDTINLLFVATLLGVLGAGIYAVVRRLMIGPRWFQVVSVAVGPAVVVGAMLVHTDGVDFQLLEPVWLAIGLFVAIPGVYAALLTLLAERWLRDESWAIQAPLPIAASPLVLWVPLAPLLAVLAALWAAREWVRRRAPQVAVALGRAEWGWVGRFGLAVIFVLAMVDLGSDAAELAD
jgi:hypothetical protein